MTYRVLTGITTTGTPHLGNFVGAIRPAIAASREPGVESFFFLADFHALIKCDEPARIERSRLELAATWLAAGLDPERVVFYRQSDIPETPELTWLLTCVAAKGQMNRAHAYKAALDANAAAGDDPDANISMGLYSYPILMAADILLFNAHRVPVGSDQKQHIEIARDLGARFNHLFGDGLFVLPEAQIDEQMALLPGLDGRKMSKSYDNVIPLFEGGAQGLKDAVARIVTDSRVPGEPKGTEGSALVTIHDAFASEADRVALRADLRAGLAWGEAKERLVARIESQIGPLRAEYERLMARPSDVEAILQAGAKKARAVAMPLMARLRQAVGLVPFRDDAPFEAIADVTFTMRATGTVLRQPAFKQYREGDGRFYFKLATHDGRVLLVSEGFDDAREAGAWVKRLKAEGRAALADAPIVWSAGGSRADAETALDALAAPS